MSEALLLANLVMVACMSLERIFKAFQCNMHSIRSVEFSTLCCAGEIQRQPTPPQSNAASPTGPMTPNPSAAYAPPNFEDRFRRHSGSVNLQDLISGGGLQGADQALRPPCKLRQGAALLAVAGQRTGSGGSGSGGGGGSGRGCDRWWRQQW